MPVVLTALTSRRKKEETKLAAMAYALKGLPELRYRSVALLTSNKAAGLTLRYPRQSPAKGIFNA